MSQSVYEKQFAINFDTFFLKVLSTHPDQKALLTKYRAFQKRALPFQK